MGVEIETISPGDGEFFATFWRLFKFWIVVHYMLIHLAITKLWEMQYYHILW